MDVSTIIGLVLSVIAIGGSIMLGGSLFIFVDIPSIFCVGIGVISCIFLKWPMETVKMVGAYFSKAFIYSNKNPKSTIEEITKLAETARRESIFALEKVPIEDPFLKKAMSLAADNRPPEVISAILQMEIDSMEERHKKGSEVLNGIGADGPAFGMIGTLIGLVQMLQNMSDPSSIGPAMAVALLTTFYGSCIANVIAIPFKNKLDERSKTEINVMNIIIAGTISIVDGENPRLIKEKLNAFLPYNERFADDKDGGGGGTNEAAA